MAPKDSAEGEQRYFFKDRSTPGTSRSAATVISNSSTGLKPKGPAIRFAGKTCCAEAGGNVVVELARETDFVFRRGQLFLKLADIFARSQLRVLLHHNKEFGERIRQRTLLGGGILGSVCAHGCRPSLHHFLERILLKLHDPLHGVHQVGDQVVAALQLHVNLFPPVGHLIAQTDQAVIQNDHPHDQAGDYSQKN